MLTPDYLTSCADDIMALYEAYQTSLINDMARRLVRIGVTDTTLWQMDMYQEAGGVYEDAIRRLAEISGASDAALRTVFEDAGTRTLEYDNQVYKAAGLDPIPLHASPTMLQTLTAGMQKAKATIRNLTATTAVSSQHAFIQASNLAYLQVAGGGMSHQQAISLAVKSIASEGLPVLYPSGHRDKIDVAVRRNVLTGVNQTAAQIQLQNAQEVGSEFVETTAHFGARPSHAEWQGQVFHIGGAKDGYDDFESTTGYGTGGGLCGWNCRHGFYPFIPGISTPSYTPEHLDAMKNRTVRFNGQDMPEYEATQMQRKMERDIRATKRSLSATNAAIDATDDAALKASLQTQFTKDSQKLKLQESLLKDFTASTGLAKQSDRVQVVGFGRSEAQKAVWAARKAARAVPAQKASFDSLIGTVMADGHTVRGLSIHFSNQALARGVTVENALNALKNTLGTTKIKIDNYGRPSMKYIGEAATVTYNPDTGTLVTAHGTHTKLVNRIKKQTEGR